MSRKMQYSVTIYEVDNGYLVKVGCKRLVFKDISELMHELSCYATGAVTPLSKELTKECLQYAPNVGTGLGQPAGIPLPDGIDNIINERG